MPNDSVDMDSWESLACYPRRTFYPLSDGPSMRNRRITKTYFRTCSTCGSRCQAPLCLYTLRLVSNQPEGTIARLRYSLGGDRPSQTTHHTLSRASIQKPRLDIHVNKAGISHFGSIAASATTSMPTGYATHASTNASVKL